MSYFMCSMVMQLHPDKFKGVILPNAQNSPAIEATARNSEALWYYDRKSNDTRTSAQKKCDDFLKRLRGLGETEDFS